MSDKAQPVPAVLGIALVGAESTGKTALAQALAVRLAADTGRRVAWVPELLRDWCESQGRTPLAHEQAAILRGQHERIDAAAATHDIVVCDTTALMTAVYSGLVFGDHSMDERAALLHRRCAQLTLLMALDLPWVADGLQRDGPHVRAPVDAALRLLMQRHHIDHAVIGGSGPARLDAALAAVAPLLRDRHDRHDRFDGGDRRNSAAPRLHLPGAAGRKPRWSCACCLPNEEPARRPLGAPE